MTENEKTRAWHSIPEYQALRALMQSGTTSGAAYRLGITQSAISRSISSLESRLGKTLFDREAGRLRPTLEAVRLNRRLDPLFEALDRIDGPSEQPQETLRIATGPSYAHPFLVQQISGFLRANPNILINFEVTTSEEVARGILEERYDIGVAGIELNRSGVKLLPYRRSRAVCILPQDHQLVARDDVHVEDLQGQRFIGLIYRHARRGQMDRVLHQAKIRPDLVAEVSSGLAAAELVEQGLGIAVINAFPLYHAWSQRIAFRSFASPITYRNYFLIPENRPVRRSARAFMRHLRLNTPADPFSEKE